jgi:hypothetical protein
MNNFLDMDSYSDEEAVKGLPQSTVDEESGELSSSGNNLKERQLKQNSWTDTSIEDENRDRLTTLQEYRHSLLQRLAALRNIHDSTIKNEENEEFETGPLNKRRKKMANWMKERMIHFGENESNDDEITSSSSDEENLEYLLPNYGIKRKLNTQLDNDGANSRRKPQKNSTIDLSPQSTLFSNEQQVLGTSKLWLNHHCITHCKRKISNEGNSFASSEESDISLKEEGLNQSSLMAKDNTNEGSHFHPSYSNHLPSHEAKRPKKGG